MGEVITLASRRPGATGPTLAGATDAYLDAHISAGAWSDGTAVKYRQTLTALTTPPRRRPDAPTLDARRPLADLDGDAGRIELREVFDDRFGALAPATRTRHQATLGSAITWWRGRGWLHSDPTDGWVRPKVVVDRTRALTRTQVAAVLGLDVDLRERTLRQLLYDTAARASEILTLNIEDLDLPNKRAKVISKGGDEEWVHWSTRTAHLLPRLIAGRRRGPLFLSHRLPTRAVPSADLCPETGRARLSYRRAEEQFEADTRALAHPDASAEEIAERDGWTLHQLRHSALTHDAEDGTNTPLLLARSRHASMRSLERYARPGPEAVAAHVARRDPDARRKRP
jgi:integrase/recombinase XerD